MFTNVYYCKGCQVSAYWLIEGQRGALKSISAGIKYKGKGIGFTSDI